MGKKILHAILFVILFNWTIVKATVNEDPIRLPNDLLFGTSVSAYQIEGAWNLSGLYDFLLKQIS